VRSFQWLDGSTSSARFLTPERNNVSNNLWFASAYHAELRVSGRIADWLSIEAFSGSLDSHRSICNSIPEPGTFGQRFP